MHKHYLEMPLEALCAKALFELKAAAERITSEDLGVSAHDRLRLAGWAVSVGGDINLRHAASALIPIVALLERETDCETVGHRNIFCGSIDPDGSDVGEVVALPILTERGERIKLWCGRLRRVRHMLQVIEVRLAAEEAVDQERERKGLQTRRSSRMPRGAR
ncbi:MAG: hypothetical protein ABJG14_04900 [Sulfitobacter sp.]|uniref:hypothetical protein n=1 Tax=Alphaproteobacteria TaxID=28211 RepID=UPI0032671EA4